MARNNEIGLTKGLTKIVLMSLGAGAIIGTALIFPGVGYLYKEFKKEQWEKAKRRGRLKDTIRRLETQKFISWKEKDGDLILTLTEKGKKKALKFNIDEMKIKIPNKWDGIFRVVVFDIPERNRDARNIFRKKLKDLGFYQMQKSVFVHRFECREEIDFLRHELGVAPFVNYIVAKEISRVVSDKV